MGSAVGSGVGVLVGLSVGVGKAVAVGSIVKFMVGVTVGNICSAPTQEETPNANIINVPVTTRFELIFCLVVVHLWHRIPASNR